MLLMSLCLLMWAPQDDAVTVQESLRVEYVLLDVSATTKRGKPVTDLTQDEFVIEENGEPVDITFFDTLDFRAVNQPDLSAIPAEYRHLAAEKPVQQVIVVFDMEKIDRRGAYFAFDDIEEFLDELDPGYDYQVQLYDIDKGSLTREFLKDKKRISAYLEEYKSRWYDDRRYGGSSGYGSSGGGRLLVDHDPGSGASRQFRRYDADFHSLRSLEEELENCMGSYACLSRVLEDYIEGQYTRTLGIIGKLELLAYDFQDVDGIKIMLFISPGFVMQEMRSLKALASRYGIDGGAIRDPFQTEQFELQQEFRKVGHACIKNRVIFYTFDPFNANASFDRSFDVSSDSPGNSSMMRYVYRDFMVEISNGLANLAEDSGGDFFQSRGLQRKMKDVMEENAFFYVIGYASPQDAKSGSYRRIKVDTSRRKVKLAHRKGYFGQ